MNEPETSAALQGRVIGLDMHPDVFSAAALSGRDAAQARVEQSWDRRATADLETWARTLVRGDLVVLEASGNTFATVERLRAVGVQAVVLESQRDRLDAVKLGRIYLSGLAHTVWTPDAQTRERREVLQTYNKAVTTATRTRNRLKSFLSDHAVRLKKGVRLTEPSGETTVLASREWSALQAMLLKEMLAELRLAQERRKRLEALMAQQVAAEPQLLQLVRLLGVRHIIAFAIGAVVGDIARFANPKKLVAYLGLAPTAVRSGNGGRGDLRHLLIQSAQNALNQRSSPWHSWGWKLCLRKSNKNVAVAAIARKLTVSIWYLLRGLFAPLKAIDASLEVKLTKLATAIGVQAIRQLGYQSKAAFLEEKKAWLLKPT
jgi:transposase